MELHFYTPLNDTLKQYIEGYYFLSDDGSEGNEEEYLTFPNNYCIISANLNSKISFEKNKILVEPSSIPTVHTSFVHRYVNPIVVHYKKPFHEITIYFKPLGINYFTDNLKTMFSQKKMTAFTPQFLDFKEEMNRIFHIGDRSLQVAALEDYWLSKLMVKDFTFMRTILADIESNMKIEDIAKKHHISRKHLNTMFQKNLGKSPIEYRKIFRFRKAINSKEVVKNLTELSYASSFFDQSHLIKDFKSLTRISPQLFFKHVNTSNKNVWLFA